jgi:hypothetical protein
VRRRLEGICAATDTALDQLPLYVITAPRLLLDTPQDRRSLRRTVAELEPALLVLDPFIRLHRADENASKEVAPLLGYLRELQREFHMAVLLVHHVRKRSGKDRPGQALRGSSDLHGWGDSNLYLRRNCKHLVLAIEHRAAPSSDDLTVDLLADGPALSLSVLDAPAEPQRQPVSPAERVVQAMTAAATPLSAQQLRKLCSMRTATLCDTLADLQRQRRVVRGPDGYRLTPPEDEIPVSFPATPIGSTGNGNGKRPDQPQLPLALNHQLP